MVVGIQMAGGSTVSMVPAVDAKGGMQRETKGILGSKGVSSVGEIIGVFIRD